MITNLPAGPTTRTRLRLWGTRVGAWTFLGVVSSIVATGWVTAHLGAVSGQATVGDLVVIVAISSVMWVICFLPTFWLVHGRLGDRLRPEIWHDLRRLWRHLSADRPVARVDASESISIFPRVAPARAPVPVTSARLHATPRSGPEAGPRPIPPEALALLKVPVWLRAHRPESLLLNGVVPPLASDGDVLTAPWAIGAFVDVVQHGFTGVALDVHTPITTARKDLLDIGIRIAAEVVGTKVPARLRERLEQRQFLVTACVLKHYGMPVADDVRAMLIRWGYDPRLMWGAVDAYLSGYYHCRSWEMARAMSPRHFCLPPPPDRVPCNP